MKLDKKSILYRAFRDIISILAVLFFSGATTIRSLDFVVMFFISLLFFLVIFLALFWEYLVWSNYDYFIQDENIKISHGVFRKNNREIPIKRIQNVDIKRNILHRLLGIAQVNLETAGGNTTEASLKYTSENTSRKIQKEISERKRQIRENIKDKGDEQEKEIQRELLFEIKPKELGILSVSSINIRILFGLFIVFGFMGSFVGSILEQYNLVFLTGGIFILFLVLLFVWIGSIITVVLKYFGFKLWSVGNSLEYERGLLNRSEGSIPLEKIQKLTIEENPLKRFFGYSTLKIETAGYSSGGSSRNIPESAIPLAETRRTLKLAKNIEDFNDFKLKNISSRAKRRYIGRYSLVFLFILGVSLVLDFILGFNFVFSFILVPFIPLAGYLKWKHRGYDLGDDYFYTRNGFWNRRTMIVPYYRIQNILESQTILQRRWGLSSLTIDIAGTNTFQRDPTISDLDTDDLRSIKDKIYSKFRESLIERSKQK